MEGCPVCGAFYGWVYDGAYRRSMEELARGGSGGKQQEVPCVAEWSDDLSSPSLG